MSWRLAIYPDTLQAPYFDFMSSAWTEMTLVSGWLWCKHAAVANAWRFLALGPGQSVFRLCPSCLLCMGGGRGARALCCSWLGCNEPARLKAWHQVHAWVAVRRVQCLDLTATVLPCGGCVGVAGWPSV